jgi:Tol biopolymer transport system component/C-terminal processing protease CtpA/Prc
MMKPLPVIVAAFAVAAAASAQLISPTQDPVVGARMPALSPDGQELAFVYRGDVWVVSSQGGSARPLTQHVEADANPLFSPDGRWIAFASKRNGNWDIFAAPSGGGAARQLTWHSGSETPHGWSPDGSKILFTTRRDTPNFGIYSVDVMSLRTELMAEDFASLNGPGYSPDGKLVVYGRYGFPWTRPRYHGSAAQQIWLLELPEGKGRPVTTNDTQHLWTQFMPDGAHLLTVTVGEKTPSSSPLRETVEPFLDNAARTPNLWLFDLEGRGKQVTHFIGGGVRFPSVAARSGDVAFEYGSDIWLMRRGDHAAPAKLALLVAADEKQTTRKREKLTSGVSDAELSPDGKTIAFELRGDLWTVATEKPKGVAGRNADFAVRLTDWAGDDSDFSWSPDGSKLYFTSDREFTTRLYELDVKSDKATPLWNGNDNISQVTVSPDGKQLGFWVSGKEGGLYVLTIETGESRRVVRIPGPQWRGIGGGDFNWSPDMKWIAYSARSESRAWNIFIVPASGGEPVNVTRLYAQHAEPAWSLDGRYLYFQSNREGEGLYALPLKPESVRSEDTDLKFEKPGTNLVVEIDFNNIAGRIRKISSQAPRANVSPVSDGSVLFVSEGDIWSVSYDGKQTRRLTTGGGKSALRVARNGKKASYVQGGDLYVMGIDGKGSEKVSFKAEWERDVRAERRAAFTQFWNAYQRGFYDPNFHGRDWAAIREAYEPLLDAVDTQDEFAVLLNMMVGELDASHSEVRVPPASSNSPVTPQLGFTFDYDYPGPGVRVAGVPEDAPGSFEKTLIKPGDVILAINHTDVGLTEKLYEIINDRQDREFEFLISTNGDRAAARTVHYKALTAEEWNELNYRNRIEKLRRHVEERSAGRVGYVHIEAMGANNQARFEREAYEYMAGKDAMIIDVRFNRGGNIADTLIDWIERKPHGWTRSRDAKPEATPYMVWEKKCVVLMNEHSYSNGEIFPSAMRTRGLATLVGMPTPGYVIWTFEQRLVDGTQARLPLTGSYRLDGSNQENIGEIPDYIVPMSAEDWLKGRDPQLDKAIELLTSSKDSSRRLVAGDEAKPGRTLNP